VLTVYLTNRCTLVFDRWQLTDLVSRKVLISPRLFCSPAGVDMLRVSDTEFFKICQNQGIFEQHTFFSGLFNFDVHSRKHVVRGLEVTTVISRPIVFFLKCCCRPYLVVIILARAYIAPSVFHNSALNPASYLYNSVGDICSTSRILFLCFMNNDQVCLHRLSLHLSKILIDEYSVLLLAHCRLR
jgi:hypothetical protein